MAKPYHEEKKAYKRMKRKLVTPWKTLGIICLVLALILAPMTIVLTMFDNTIALFTGAYFWELVDEDPTAQYFNPDFETDQDRLDRGFELVKQVEGEGAALLLSSLPRLHTRFPRRISNPLTKNPRPKGRGFLRSGISRRRECPAAGRSGRWH